MILNAHLERFGGTLSRFQSLFADVFVTKVLGDFTFETVKVLQGSFYALL